VLRFVLQELGILLGGLSDCEELVGVPHWRWWVYSVWSDRIEIIWCSRSPIVPRNSIWWSEDVTVI